MQKDKFNGERDNDIIYQLDNDNSDMGIQGDLVFGLHSQNKNIQQLISESSSSDGVNENYRVFRNKKNKKEIAPPNKKENCKKNSQKYQNDIIQILEYAEETNPYSLVLELCANLKWEVPDVESFEIVEDHLNVYKTQIKLKCFKGEGIGITKKISRKKACVDLITKMLEDKTVRDSMRIYISTKSITRDCKLKQNVDDEGAIDVEDEKFEKPVFTETDLDHERVKQIITNYSKDVLVNPLSQLDSFRNRFNIPFCFTYSIKEKLHKAVLYVGGEIFSYGVDANIRVAKYKAAEEGIKKIKEKYGMDSLKYKAVERRRNKLHLMEEKKIQEEKSMISIPCKVTGIKKSEDILKIVDSLCKNENNSSTRNLEIFLLKYERTLLLFDDFFEIQKILALIFHSNKTLSIHFSNPVLAGSFQYDCANALYPVIDIILYHQIVPKEIKEALDILATKFKLLLKEFSNDFNVVIKNRLNETNMDILVTLKNKPYSFRLLIRDDEYKQFIYYLKFHNSKISNQTSEPIIFNSIRRLFRMWRRQYKLIFLKPEVLDWAIKIFLKESIAVSILKILHKCCKDFVKIYYTNKEIPEIIKKEVESLTDVELDQIKSSMKSILNNLVNGDYNKLN